MSSKEVQVRVSPEQADHHGPRFPIRMASGIFFGRSPAWLRSHELQGSFQLDGEPLEFGRDERGARVFTLTDIEHMAHALYRADKIDEDRMKTALEIAVLVGRQYGIASESIR